MSSDGVIGATGDTLRWLAVDNPLSQSLLSGVSQMVGYTNSCVRQARAGQMETTLRQPPVRWLLTGPGRGAVQLAGLSGASAVALGAYGAHKLKANKDANPELVQVFDTANRYHMLHSLALLGAPLSRRPALVAALLSSGMLVFSGTCYYYALTGDSSVRKFTPYGGMLLIAGWLAMAL